MITSNTLEHTIFNLIEPSVTHMGYRVVQLRLKEKSKNRPLEIFIERLDEQGMTVEDCSTVSERVSALLEVEDIIGGGEYQLEVSSTGLDRPLTRLEDFTAFSGFEAKLETKLPMEGRRRFRGVLHGVDDQNVLFECDGKPIGLPFSALQSAKLVETPEMVAALFKAQNSSA